MYLQFSLPFWIFVPVIDVVRRAAMADPDRNKAYGFRVTISKQELDELVHRLRTNNGEAPAGEGSRYLQLHRKLFFECVDPHGHSFKDLGEAWQLYVTKDVVIGCVDETTFFIEWSLENSPETELAILNGLTTVLQPWTKVEHTVFQVDTESTIEGGVRKETVRLTELPGVQAESFLLPFVHRMVGLYLKRDSALMHLPPDYDRELIVEIPEHVS